MTTTFTAGANAFDMTAIDLSDFGGGTITASSATEIDVTGAGGVIYKLIGTGFGAFDADGFPTTGTVTGFDIGTGHGSPAAFAGLGMTASTFMGFVHGDDLTGFETSALSANNKIAGSAGNDVLVGFGGNDIINLAKGGNDSADGGAGNDQFSMAGALTASDTLQGGAGDDRVILSGDYSAGLTLGATTFSSIEYMTLAKGHSYDLVMNDANLAAGTSMNVNAKALLAGQSLTFDASAETDGAYRISAGAGDDTLIGGAGDDALSGGNGNNIFDLSHGGNDIAVGGTGSDTFLMGGAFDGSDKINGGDGNDTVVFDGHYAGSIVIKNTQLQHVETLQFKAGNSYTVEMDITSHAIVPYTIDASRLGAGDSLTFSAATGMVGTAVIGGAGNDVIHAENLTYTRGEANVSSVDLTQGGDDTVYVSDNNTIVYFGGTLNSSDTVTSSGSGASINLDGDYSAGLTLSKSFLKGAEDTFDLQSGHNYDLTVSSNLGAAGFVTLGSTAGSVTIDDSAGSGALLFGDDGNASFDVTGTSHADTYTALQPGSIGTGTIHAGAGDDIFQWSGLNASDTLDGGSGNDILYIENDNASFSITGSMVQSIEQINTGTNDTVTLADGVIAPGQNLTMEIDTGSHVDDSAETDGTLTITLNVPESGAGSGVESAIAGAGNDTLTDDGGNAIAVTMTGGGGADTITCGAGSTTDTLVYNAASDSTGVNFDTVSNFATANDVFNMPGTISGVDATVTSGALHTATFDTDLAAAIGAGQMGAHHAVLFTPTSGDYNGDTFLIIDANGTAGYQAGADYVIELSNAQNLASLSTANFT
jgi:Ca2+-binding RTX toxin-like protein